MIRRLRRTISDSRAMKKVRRLMRPAWLGTLRRTTPLSDAHGFDRGTPIDRYYIERFLAAHRDDIRGRVLEVGDDRYTRLFGSDVSHADVLDIMPENKGATIIADLAAADAIASDQYDCFILTQTLHLLYDVPAAIAHAHRVLRPDGRLLATVPGVGRVANPADGTTYWSFTVASCTELFGAAFGRDNVSVASYGNVLACIGRLTGLACEDLSLAELDVNDARFPLVVAVRAVKSS